MKKTKQRPKLSKYYVSCTGKMCLTIPVSGVKPLLFTVRGVRDDNRFVHSNVR